MIFNQITSGNNGTPIEVSTNAEMVAKLVSSNVGKAYKFIGTTGTYINGDIYIVEAVSLFTGLCFTAEQANSTVSLTKNGSPAWTGSYSTDGTIWNEYIPSTTGEITLVNIGDKVYFKGDITDDFSDDDYLSFAMTGSIAASGNCNSMYVSSGFDELTELVYESCFYCLFQYCVSLTTPPSLPATSLRYACYCNMFFNCSSLIEAPLLPATNLNEMCYYGMFSGCTSLTVPPSLPATILEYYCYCGMFSQCSSLVKVPILPATTLAEYCYCGMFSECTSLQVNDSPVSGVAEQTWKIPANGTFTETYEQSQMFYECAGTRVSYDMPGEEGESYTYYTQNAPV